MEMKLPWEVGSKGWAWKEREGSQKGLTWGAGGWPRGGMAWADPKADHGQVSGALALLTLRVCHVREFSVFLKHLRALEGALTAWRRQPLENTPGLKTLILVPISLPPPPRRHHFFLSLCRHILIPHPVSFLRNLKFKSEILNLKFRSGTSLCLPEAA